jgi:hypothetical protein
MNTGREQLLERVVDTQRQRCTVQSIHVPRVSAGTKRLQRPTMTKPMHNMNCQREAQCRW